MKSYHMTIMFSYDFPALREMGTLFSRILSSVVDESESEF